LAMAWQSVNLLPYWMAGGAGPGGVPTRAGKERPGLVVLSAASFSIVGPPAPTAANVDAVRSALEGWGVTLVVVPDPTRLPRYDQGTDPGLALGLFTAAIGRGPEFEDDAWVWKNVQAPSQRLSVPLRAFEACTYVPVNTENALNAVSGCVMTAALKSA
jgi:hypothetical protein